MKNGERDTRNLEQGLHEETIRSIRLIKESSDLNNRLRKQAEQDIIEIEKSFERIEYQCKQFSKTMPEFLNQLQKLF
jgi:hypothetical protein